MQCILGVDNWDSVIHADPLELMEVSAHQIVHHVSSLANEESEKPASLVILGVFLGVHHLKNHALAHGGNLHGGAPVVVNVVLVLFDCLSNSKMQDLGWRRIC